MRAGSSSFGGRLKAIDFLRGVAALAVVLHHAFSYGPYREIGETWFQALSAVALQGHLGVPLFFVISGFCIHLPYARRKSGGSSASVGFIQFWKRRVRRLYPPYFVVLCLSMTLVLAAYLRHANVPLVTNYAEPRLHSMGADFLAHVFMLHGLIPAFDKAGGNPPLWTLAREEYLYLLYFILLFWRGIAGIRWGALGTLALGLGLQAAVRAFAPPAAPEIGVVDSSAIALWIQWALGAVAVEAHFGLIKLPEIAYRLELVPLWFGAASWCDSALPILSPLLWGITFFTLLNFCVRREARARWRGRGLVGWLENVGIFSYSLYLIHSPARALGKQALGPLAATTNSLMYCFNAILLVIGGYWSAKVLFRLVESKFLNTPAPKPVKVELFA
jgi:peptidoglycan/LPS O-acetylase OafA/YrhL